MNVFVIGGTGFISGRMVDVLLARQHEVTIFTRGRSKRKFSRSIEHIAGDRTSARSLREAVRGRTFDAVIDMIAYDGADSRAAVEGLVGSSGRFIHCSTVSVYMVSEEPTCPITEDQDDLPVMEHWPRNPFGMGYGLGKRECERVLWEAQDRGDFSVTSLRPTFVCGPEDKSARDYFWIQRILDGGPLLVPGSGDHAFQQVYVDDAARAFADAVEEDAASGSAYNVVGEDIYSLNEYIRRMAALLDRDVELEHLPQHLFDELPLSSHSRGDVFPFNTRRTAVFSLDRIKLALDYHATPFDEWMGSTILWYLDQLEGDSLGYDRRDEELAVVEAIRRGKTDPARALRAP